MRIGSPLSSFSVNLVADSNFLTKVESPRSRPCLDQMFIGRAGDVVVTSSSNELLHDDDMELSADDYEDVELKYFLKLKV